MKEQERVEAAVRESWAALKSPAKRKGNCMKNCHPWKRKGWRALTGFEGASEEEFMARI